jgi:hypothetical protein
MVRAPAQIACATFIARSDGQNLRGVLITFGSDGVDFRAAIKQRVERVWIASTSTERFPGDEIANLLEEALEEDAPERRLTQIVTALGLLLASLNCPPDKEKPSVESRAAEPRTPHEVLRRSA